MSLEDLKNNGTSPLYQQLLQEIVTEAREQDNILGILLIGSVGRGDALPGSDLDMRFILPTGMRRHLQSEVRYGVLVECGYADMALARSKLETKPMEVYAYLDGNILFDPLGLVEQLTEQAKHCFESYQCPEPERNAISYWLMSVRLKLLAALKAGDLLKGAYVSSTASWPILTGLWAANDRPIPPNGSVWVHLKDLSKGPPGVEELLRQFFGGETLHRIQTAIDLIDWIIAHLGSG